MRREKSLKSRIARLRRELDGTDESFDRPRYRREAKSSQPKHRRARGRYMDDALVEDEFMDDALVEDVLVEDDEFMDEDDLDDEFMDDDIIGEDEFMAGLVEYETEGGIDDDISQDYLDDVLESTGVSVQTTDIRDANARKYKGAVRKLEAIANHLEQHGRKKVAYRLDQICDRIDSEIRKSRRGK